LIEWEELEYKLNSRKQGSTSYPFIVVAQAHPFYDLATHLAGQMRNKNRGKK